ncbi:oligoendopeptidase F [Solimonas terrae]|uniref:Oligopeptidase F n=1 Tax=Solimonas terrae TaxID=1396819 RepID=A0A6M2BUT2_9GAMM|nr:oligoendopeptidase F [Solimonas terrae]NGY05961.1 oligoendopeptidase F [Solimonas terrae]
MRIAAAGLLMVMLAGPVFADDPAYRWNLADLYPDVAAWNADAGKLQAQLKDLEACRGHLADSRARFKSCLDLQSDAARRYYRLRIYSSQLLDEANDKASSQELDQRANNLGTAFGEAASSFAPEILAIGEQQIDGWLAQDQSLAIYRHPLADILRGKAHTLDAEGESIIATLSATSDAPQNTYGMLSSADLPWPTLKLDGQDVRLDQAAYTKYRSAADRDERKQVFDAFFGKWKEYENTFGATFYGMLKNSSAYAKVRHYPDSLAQALDGSAVPAAVYDTLIQQTEAHLPTLHRYFRLRARLLGIDELHYYDLYVPIVKSSQKYPIATGEQLMLDAVKPLGADYVAAMRKGVGSRWMDVYPRPHKTSGAHMAGNAYDVHPYLLINYNDDYESVSTIAHEWGHAMHTVLANKAQPFVTSDYPIFIAEIASTLNEALLLDHMLKIARSDDEKLFYLGSALENLRTTYFRQAMFATFEREVHARADRGEALTGEGLTQIYGDILRKYHGDTGDAHPPVRIDDIDAAEWMYIPHFYNPFYVYQYATSIAASSEFAQDILDHKPGARERYLNLLRAGGSDYPYELVKKAGVDLASPAPYDAIAARMDHIMDQIEAILARRDAGQH